MPKKNQNFVVGLVPNSSQTIWIHYSALQNVSFLCQRLRSSDWEKKKRKQHMHTPGNTGDTVGHVKEEASVNVSGGSCPICSIMLVIWTKLCWKFFSMWPAVFFFFFFVWPWLSFLHSTAFRNYQTRPARLWETPSVVLVYLQGEFKANCKRMGDFFSTSLYYCSHTSLKFTGKLIKHIFTYECVKMKFYLQIDQETVTQLSGRHGSLLWCFQEHMIILDILRNNWNFKAKILESESQRLY